MSKTSRWGKVVFRVGLFLLLVLFVNIFLLGLRRANVSNMRKERKMQAAVLITKWDFGPRLIQTPISLPLFPNVYSSLVQWSYVRLPGLGSIKPGDMLAFNFPGQNDCPVDKKDVRVSRCVAGPGDTLRIERSRVYRNGQKIEFPGICFMYRVVAEPSIPAEPLLARYNPNFQQASDRGIWDLMLSPEDAGKLSREPGIINVRRLFFKESFRYLTTFPGSNYFPWSKDDFGPVLIPRKGTTVEFDPVSFLIFRRIIEEYEKNVVELKDTEIWINGIPAQYYTFRKDYFFVLDDNRDGASDSRHWGFLPEDHIIGKCLWGVK